MKLKNYTSGVAVEKSISEIEKLLIGAGATAISKFYEGGKTAGFIFQIPFNGVPIVFKLPSNPEAVRRVMMKPIKKKHKGTEKRINEQSERTAWALLKDWVHVQISMVNMEQGDGLQMFLAYAYNEKNSTTFYDQIKDSGFKLLSSGK